MEINKNTNVYELLEKYPQIEAKLEEHGLTCSGCPGAVMETLEDAARGHDADLESLLETILKEIGVQE